MAVSPEVHSEAEPSARRSADSLSIPVMDRPLSGLQSGPGHSSAGLVRERHLPIRSARPRASAVRPSGWRRSRQAVHRNMPRLTGELEWASELHRRLTQAMELAESLDYP
ncbi:unnamed protein product [Protopolystoma xenopodis]|uniref:Uncharacterized protein n=1 Tax=Protopolystoma xenopodis TaxID=117903 RepID=A0A3S4ZPW7_9PLAT|nr:unnamed protein product [Protopolystoma xenopodis]